MTREEIIEQYPIALAEKEGKQIQYYSESKKKWIDCIASAIYGKEKLRIKPEPTKRLPTIEEVEKWFLENKVFRYKDGMLCRMLTIDVDSHPIGIDGDYETIEEFCRDYTHYDGSELYITE